jgi:hypothetical protein
MAEHAVESFFIMIDEHLEAHASEEILEVETTAAATEEEEEEAAAAEAAATETAAQFSALEEGDAMVTEFMDTPRLTNDSPALYVSKHLEVFMTLVKQSNLFISHLSPFPF